MTLDLIISNLLSANGETMREVIIETNYGTDTLLKEAYNRHNFGGTPHNPKKHAKSGANPTRRRCAPLQCLLRWM